MTVPDEPSETTPLIASSSTTSSTITVKNQVKPNKHPIDSGGADDDNDEDDSLAKPDYEGLPEVRKQLKYIIFALASGIFLASCDQTIIASSYGTIGSDFNSLKNSSWLATSYLLTQTSFQPLYGKLSDIFGRKPVILFSYVLFAVGSLGCGLAPSMNWLIMSRALTGIGGAGNTMSTIILSDIVPLRERGTWQAVINLIFATGASAGAPLGGIIADSIGWRWAFLGQIPMSILSFVSIYLVLDLPETDTSHWRSKLRRVDFYGATFLISSLFFLLLGLHNGSSVSWTSPITILETSLFQPLFAVFLLVERKYAAEPFAPPRIMFDRNLLPLYLCSFFSLAGWFGAVFYIPLFYQAIDDLNAFDAGVRLLPGILGSVLGAFFAGVVLRKTGKYYWLCVVSYAFVVAGGFLILVSTGFLMKSSTGINFGLIIGGLGNGSALTTTLVALISNVGQEDQAVVTSVSYLFRSLGTTVGLALISTFLQQVLKSSLAIRLHGSAEIDEIVKRVRESLDYIKSLDPDMQVIVRLAYDDALQRAFMLMVGFMLAAFGFSWFIQEKRLSK